MNMQNLYFQKGNSLENENMIGCTFGRLTILEISHKDNKRTYLKAKCLCGKISKDCHKVFHKLYGKRNNNIEQFNTFINQ